ncbi:MAG TPA: YdcF family protein [Firmicutes bacterium]|nr:YdcF family protein [Bacillota bacterium]
MLKKIKIWFSRHEKGLLRAKNIIFIILGALLVADTIFVSRIIPGNLGAYLPAMLGLPILILGVLDVPLRRFFKLKWGRALKYFIMFCYAFFLITFGISLILISSVPTEENQTDAVIVLGSGVSNGRVSPTLQYRLDAAYDYAVQYPDALVVVSGGKGEINSPSEAAVMRDYLVARGLKEDRIILEERSQSTYQNLKYSKEILDNLLGEDYTVTVATSKFHAYRARRIALDLGMDAGALPAKTVWYMELNNYLREYLSIYNYLFIGYGID